MSDEQQLTLNTKQYILKTFAYLTDRLALSRELGSSHNGQRDYYEELGYKTTLTYDNYLNLYKREIAGRIIDLPVDTTYKGGFTIEEDEEADETPFEATTKELLTRLNATDYIKRADRLASIGRYSVILIGVKGSTALSAPIRPTSLRTPDSILYLSVFSEKNADIKELDTNPRSERFGKPLLYEITMGKTKSGIERKEVVHWSRVIHVTEKLLEDDTLGVPKLERVANRFEDLIKTVGGSSEMFWQNASGFTHANYRDGFVPDPMLDDASEDIEAEIEAFAHKLRKVLITEGMDVQRIEGATPDPTGIFNTLKQLIAGAANIPARILFGTESGELASSLDQDNYYDDIEQRRETHAEPHIIRPLIDRFILIGALPPVDYSVVWEPLKTMTETQRADIMVKKSNAIRAYVGSRGDATQVVPAHEYRSEVLELEEAPPSVPAEMAGVSLEQVGEVEPDDEDALDDALGDE